MPRQLLFASASRGQGRVHVYVLEVVRKRDTPIAAYYLALGVHFGIREKVPEYTKGFPERFWVI